MTVDAAAGAAADGGAILVLGIGNVLWADEGFGVRAVEQLHRQWVLPSEVSVVDGGTQGLALLDCVSAADCLLLFDAVDYRLAPGTLVVLRDDDVPAWSDTAMSLHQATFQELLAIARFTGKAPRRITLVGVQPAVLDDLGGSLSSAVKAQLQPAVDAALAELRAWGVEPLPRAESDAEPLSPGALALHAYESGRPSAADACRHGDARFLAQQHGAA